MKSLKTTALIAAGICSSLALLLPPATLGRQSVAKQQWGEPVGGLQMSISARDASGSGVPEFQVSLQNVGEQDVTLNLGIMLANGKVQLPRRIGLTLTDGNGVTRRLKFFDKRYPAVMGRVDDYVVPLRAGSTYVLTLSLDQFWSPDTNDFQLKLLPGRYHIAAHFEGAGAKAENLDTPGIRLMNFWKGGLQSNVLAVER